MRFVTLVFENGDERLSWGNLGEVGELPDRAHNLETDVDKAQRERKKLQELTAKKSNGFGCEKQRKNHHHDKKAQHKATEPTRLITVTTEDGTRYSLWG